MKFLMLIANLIGWVSEQETYRLKNIITFINKQNNIQVSCNYLLPS